MNDSILPAQDIFLENPWPGLTAYTEENHTLFFGRQQEITALYRLVKRESLTVFYGQSGLGKTSLVNAGLFPILRKEAFLPVYVRLDYSPTSPDLPEQIFQALANNCARQGVDAPTPHPGERLWEYFLILTDSLVYSASTG